MRQRVRWARGLIQTLNLHRKVFFNPKYGLMGIIFFPYFVFCEFLVPILEFIGIIVIVCDILFFSISYDFFYLLLRFLFIYFIFPLACLRYS